MNINNDLQMQIVAREGKVILLFSVERDGNKVAANTDHMMLPPDAALRAAEVLANVAFEADTNLKPVGPALKAELVQKHREKLIPRIALMLGSLRENRMMSNGQIATQIMDAVCSEVFS